MDLNNLRTFLCVVEQGSFTKAAASLQWPKSKVSRRMSALESELGIQLLHRTTRQLQLTEAGRQLFANCKTHLAGVDRALADVSTSSEDVAGSIKVTAPSDIGRSLLWPVVQEHMRLFPRVVVDLNLTNELVDVIATGTDVALRLGRLKDSTLRTRKLGYMTVSMLASPNYLDREGAPSALSDLHNHTCLSFRTGKEEAQWRLKCAGKQRNIKILPTFFCNNIDVLLTMVLDGMGICMLPEQYCQRHLSSGRLIRVLPKWKTTPVPLQMLHSGSRAPARVKNFMELAQRRIQPQLA